MLEKSRLSTIKLKNISKQEVSYCPQILVYILRRNLNFQKKTEQFYLSRMSLWFFVKMKVIALLEQKLGFFTHKNISKKLENVW